MNEELEQVQKGLEKEIERNLETVETLVDALIAFGVEYGFQILGALVFLLIGLKAASWMGRKASAMALSRNVDPTLAKFMGGGAKLVLVVVLAIITLGNFGISIAPLIALAGASAFGATMAIQGPLSNYGAGLSIILGRPFVVGDTITVKGASGVVGEVTLAYTILEGEDGERVTIPNKEIVGQVIVNSHAVRVVETRIAVAADQDADKAVETIRAILAAPGDVAKDPRPQVGVHDFTYGGVIVGVRFWAPSKRYFQVRYAANHAMLSGLRAAGIQLLPATAIAQPLSADGESIHGA